MGDNRVPYRPANAAETDAFYQAFCFKCTRDNYAQKNSCPILACTMAFDVGDQNYPLEWRSDGPLGPRCTSFEAKVTA